MSHEMRHLDATGREVLGRFLSAPAGPGPKTLSAGQDALGEGEETLQAGLMRQREKTEITKILPMHLSCRRLSHCRTARQAPCESRTRVRRITVAKRLDKAHGSPSSGRLRTTAQRAVALWPEDSEGESS